MADQKYTPSTSLAPMCSSAHHGAPEKPPNPSSLPTKQRGRPRKYPKPRNYKAPWPEGIWNSPEWTAVWRAWRTFIIAEKRRTNVAKARQTKLHKVQQHPPNRLINGDASESLRDRVRFLYHEYRFGEVGATHRQAVKLIAARLRQDEKMIASLINEL